MIFITMMSQDVEKSRRFYERLSHAFNREQHGGGAEHYASEGVVEIYPQLKSLANEKFFVGLTIENPQAAKEDLLAHYGGQETTPPTPLTKSGIATLRDPSGILVRLFPKK